MAFISKLTFFHRLYSLLKGIKKQGWVFLSFLVFTVFEILIGGDTRPRRQQQLGLAANSIRQMASDEFQNDEKSISYNSSVVNGGIQWATLLESVRRSGSYNFAEYYEGIGFNTITSSLQRFPRRVSA